MDKSANKSTKEQTGNEGPRRSKRIQNRKRNQDTPELSEQRATLQTQNQLNQNESQDLHAKLKEQERRSYKEKR